MPFDIRIAASLQYYIFTPAVTVRNRLPGQLCPAENSRTAHTRYYR
jgi:hypothetical protein